MQFWLIYLCYFSSILVAANSGLTCVAEDNLLGVHTCIVWLFTDFWHFWDFFSILFVFFSGLEFCEEFSDAVRDEAARTISTHRVINQRCTIGKECISLLRRNKSASCDLAPQKAHTNRKCYGIFVHCQFFN